MALEEKIVLDTSDVLKKLKGVDDAFDKTASNSVDALDDINKQFEQLKQRADKLAQSVKPIGTGLDNATGKARQAGPQLTALFGQIGIAATAAAGVIAGIGTAIAVVVSRANQALSGLKAERAFANLAETAGTSSDTLLDSLRRATGGTVDDLTLMQTAVDKTQRKVEELARQKFGLDVSQLSEAQQQALLVEASLDVAREAAGMLGDAVDETGRSFERMKTAAANAEQDINEGFFILADRGALVAENLIRVFFGPQGFFPLLNENLNIFQEAAAAATSAFLAAAATIAKRVIDVKDLFAGELSASEFFDPTRAAEQFGTAFEQAMTKAKSDYAEIFSPGEGAEVIGDFFAGAGEKAGQDAADEISKALEKMADVRADASQKMEQAEVDFGRDLADIDRDFERKRLDIAIEAAQQREDAARNNLQKLEDIQRGYSQDVTDAATDLARKEAEIARKHGQDRIDLEREQRQNRLDIETEYRRKLQDIQRQFLIDADEAEQKRDAVGYLRALKQRNEKVQEATIERNRTREDTRLEGEQRLEELRIQQQRELEEARIHNEQKLEDLRTNLDRQIEAQNIAYARQLEDITLNEQRKNEAAALARQQDIEDAKLAYERKLSDLKAALDAELAALAEFVAAKAALEAQAGSSYNPKYKGSQYQVPAGTSHGPGGRPASTPLGLPPAGTSHGPPRRQFGGPVAGGMPYTVGEAGPELFVPRGAGAIVPSGQFVGNAFTPQSAISNISANRTQQITIPAIGADLLANPIFMHRVRNILLNELGKLG